MIEMIILTCFGCSSDHPHRTQWRKSCLNSNCTFCMAINRASDISCSRGATKFRLKSVKSREIHKNTKNAAKFGRNVIKYMSVQHIWNLLQWWGLFTCRKLANLSWNFVTETCKQHSETTRRRLSCKKLDTSHDVKGFAIGSFLERIVVERAKWWPLLEKR